MSVALNYITLYKERIKEMSNGITEEIIKSTADKFIAMLEENKGKGEWVSPFFQPQRRAINVETKKRYRGFNYVLLSFIQKEKGYTSNKWGTFDQWKKAKRFVKKGEKATGIIFWKPIKVTTEEKGDDGESIERMIPLMRYYYVFNECQLQDYVPENVDDKPMDENIVHRIELFKDNYLDRIGAVYSEGHGHACYIPSRDVIELPSMKQYNRDMLEEYIPTACHETVHWSGAKSRLNRDLSGRFGDESYAFEELVADIGAGFISQEFGHKYMFSKNNLKYIENWIRMLQDKPKTIITACSLAQKAADYLLKLADHED